MSTEEAPIVHESPDVKVVNNTSQEQVVEQDAAETWQILESV
jgi:hypothetical protein